MGSWSATAGSDCAGFESRLLQLSGRELRTIIVAKGTLSRCTEHPVNDHSCRCYRYNYVFIFTESLLAQFGSSAAADCCPWRGW